MRFAAFLLQPARANFLLYVVQLLPSYPLLIHQTSLGIVMLHRSLPTLLCADFKQRAKERVGLSVVTSIANPTIASHK